MMFFNGYGNGLRCSVGMFGSFWGMGIGLVILILIAFMLFRSPGNRSGHSSALEALDMRFASGEITEDEYIQRKRVLKNK